MGKNVLADRNNVSKKELSELPPNPESSTGRIWKKGWRRSVKIAVKRVVQHPIEALFLVVIYLILVAIPLDWATAIGGWIGRKLGAILPMTRRARHNLALAFPELSPAEREAYLKPMWDNVGRVIMELPHIGEIAQHRVAAEGTEFILQQSAEGKPMIFMIAHCANWEMTPGLAAWHGHHDYGDLSTAQ